MKRIIPLQSVIDIQYKSMHIQYTVGDGRLCLGAATWHLNQTTLSDV